MCSANAGSHAAKPHDPVGQFVCQLIDRAVDICNFDDIRVMKLSLHND